MKNNFENVIDKDKYQVFLLACPGSFPVSFARHPWFVLNKKGEISRWEVMHLKNKSNKGFEHLYLNYKKPFLGFDVIYLIKKYIWKIKLLSLIEGDENSVAKKVIDFIENSKENYPYCNYYRFLGPNSNTYAQNVLNKFPEFNVKLSWRFIGKNFKIKQ